MDEQPVEQTPPEAPVSQVDYAHLPPPAGKSRRTLGIVVAIVVVALLAAGAYWKFGRKTTPSDATAANTPAASQQTASQTTPAATPFSSKTKTYTSSSFGLTIDYPEDWTPQAISNDQLYITSPLVKLTDAAGKRVDGKVLLRIESKQQPQTEFDKGNAMAARDSEKISYAKPTPSQRAQTYISYLQYATTTTSAVDGVYITGDTGYLKGQAIPKADFVPVQPVISLLFLTNCTDACTVATNRASVSTTLWDDASFSTPLKTILQSLVIN